jgi:hypothetical protein
VVFVRSVAMSSIVILLLMFASFVAGFWLGVESYRDMLRKKL